jgi:hypothetical protein
LHGWVHDLAFVLFVLAWFPAFFFLWSRMRKDPLWQGHTRYTLATGLLALSLLSLSGVANYLFVAAVLAWIEVTAVKLFSG